MKMALWLSVTSLLLSSLMTELHSEETKRHINDIAVGQDFHIKLGMDPALFQLTFTPAGAPTDQEPVMLMRAGSLHQETTERLFADRLQKMDSDRRRPPRLHITVRRLQLSDSGRYELRDHRGNLALLLELDVQESHVRLVGGTSHCAGSLEMKHDDEWRPVGDPHRKWSTKSASLLCRQLGCGSVVSTQRSSGSLQPIWTIPYMFQSEASLKERETDLSDTSSSRVGVICAESVRLVNGESLCSGRVEVKSNQSWVPVCHADFDQQDAQVFCRELGCGAPFLQAAIYGQVKTPMWTKEFQCGGNESVLLDCRTSDSTRNGCSPNETVGLHCFEADNVRLVGGTSNCTGRLEMKHQGEWRPVDEALDHKSLSVLCRQMDCGKAVSSKRRGAPTRQPVWKFQPSCGGHEYSLRECGAKESDDSFYTLEVKCSGPHRSNRVHHIASASSTLPGNIGPDSDLPRPSTSQRLLSGSPAPPLSRTTCYGYPFTIYTSDLGNPRPRQLYFTSDAPGSQRIQVVQNGKSLDPHYELWGSIFSVTEVTDKDAGVFSAGEDSTNLTTVLLLKLRECEAESRQDYGSDYQLVLDDHVHTVEYTPLGSPEESRVLWSRTGNPPAASEQGRGRLGYKQWTIDKVTQEDNGYYTFRNQYHKFIVRYKLTVKEQYQHINDTAVGQDFHIKLGMDPALFQLTFTPAGAPTDQEPVVLMRAGSLQQETTERLFADRLQKTDPPRRARPRLHITVSRLQLSDSGRYELRDHRGNLALLLELDVQESHVRLVGGTSHCAGSLEMKHDDEWRPVGDPHRKWSTKSASLLCRQLGCGSVVSTQRSSGSLQPIWTIPYMFQSEASLKERETDLSDTSSSRVEVICAESVRLVNGDSLCSGRVEVKSDQLWVPVCHADFDQQDAQVFCRELGCGATPFLQAAIYGQVKTPMWTKEFQCGGNESVLLDCRTSDSTRNGCSPNETVGLDCFEADDVRLVGGTSNCTGRLEMKHQGEWRPVDEALDHTSLSVLCRQMDCGNAVSSKRRGAPTRQPVWKFQPSCGGREYSLRECGAKESDDSFYTLEVKCSFPHSQPRRLWDS